MLVRRLQFLLAAAAAAVGALSPLLALDWQNRVVEARVAPLQAEISVRFGFVNRSDKPVAIRQILPNCDCLDAVADRKSYGPGDSGYIEAVFSVGDRIGSYERAIMVETDEDPQPVRLLLKVEVPATAEIEPRMVEWARGSEPAPKVVEIRLAEGLWVDFTAAVATSDQFAPRLETLEAGRRYRLTITPASTSQPANAAVRVRGRTKDGLEIVVSAYGNVR